MMSQMSTDPKMDRPDCSTLNLPPNKVSWFSCRSQVDSFNRTRSGHASLTITRVRCSGLCLHKLDETQSSELTLRPLHKRTFDRIIQILSLAIAIVLKIGSRRSKLAGGTE
jgi:hypothetical protein